MKKQESRRRIAYFLSVMMVMSMFNNLIAGGIVTNGNVADTLSSYSSTTTQGAYDTDDDNETTTGGSIQVIPTDIPAEEITTQALIIINTAEELAAMGDNLDGTYQLGQDIDLSNVEWVPIGSEDEPFTGSLDGNGHKITHFQINAEEDECVGFFGAVQDAEIFNLKLTYLEITGGDYTGGLVGKMLGEANRIEDCHLRYGSVTGEAYVGGLIGGNEDANADETPCIIGCSVGISVIGNDDATGGIIGELVGSLTKCYVTGTVEGQNGVGGIVGYSKKSTISECYVTKSVDGVSYVGGIVGKSKGSTIENCYNLASITGNSNVGGIVGKSTSSTTLSYTYSAGSVTSTKTSVGGLYGSDAKLTVENSYYDGLLSTITESTEESKTSESMKKVATYEGWDFNTIWTIEESQSYPYLRALPRPENITGTVISETMDGSGTATDPYIVRTKTHLLKIKDDLAKHYKLANDIDLDGSSWEPIIGFTGSFDGNGYTISNFIIDKPYVDSVGFFGTISNATIKNLTLEEIFVGGKTNVGALIGYAGGDSKSIINCHVIGGEVVGSNCVGGLIGRTDDIQSDAYFVQSCSTDVTVTGTYSNIGGLVGWYRGSMTKCHTSGNVTGGNHEGSSSNVGGLIGCCATYATYSHHYAHYYSTGAISYCYTTGNVTGIGNVGGLIGYQIFAQIVQSYTISSVVGTTNVGGLVGYSSLVSENTYGRYGQYPHYSMINNSFALCDITGSNNVGGLVGHAGGAMVVNNNYASGNVTGATNVGALWGIASNISAGSCYGNAIYTIPGTQYPTRVGTLTYNMKLSTTYSGWNFETIWDIKPGATYPYLRALPIPDKVAPERIMEGSGSVEDPYIIHTVDELKLISLERRAHYKLGNDIDLSGIKWTPLCNTSYPFVGSLDGAGFTIKNLRISSETEDYVGLFSAIDGATIKNLTLNGLKIQGRRYVGGLTGLASGDTKKIVNCHILNSDVIGTYYVGGLIGSTDTTGTVTNVYMDSCSSAANVIGDYDYVGGLVGYLRGSMANSYVTGHVIGGNYTKDNDYTGGLVGYLLGGSLQKSYMTGEVEGINYVGGLVGYESTCATSLCYTSGKVTGTAYVGGLIGNAAGGSITNGFVISTVKGDDVVGGLIGQASAATSVTNSYNAGKVTGDSNVGGLCGKTTSLTFVNSYYDSTINPYISQYASSIAKLTSALKISASFTNWDFENVWTIMENKSYPFLRVLPMPAQVSNADFEKVMPGTGTAEDPYMISTTTQLLNVKLDLNSCYKLANDIDLAGMTWTPIGSVAIPFTGTFDGNGHTVSNFVINESTLDYQGFFGAINNGTIANLTLSHFSIGGKDNVGGLVSYASGINKRITNCHIVNGDITGNDNVGGLVGSTDAADVSTNYITACTVNAVVRGIYNNIGGLVGWYRGSISDCTVTGNVIGGNYEDKSTNVGGLAGYIYGGIIQKCYLKANVSGDSNVGGIVGYQDYGSIELSTSVGTVEGTTNVAGIVANTYNVTIQNVFNLATVTGKDYVGGLVGIARHSTLLKNSYAAGVIKGTAYVGGLYGTSSNISVVSIYYDNERTHLPLEVVSTMSRLNAAMKIAATFTGWDFETIWDIREGKTYPYLRVLEIPKGIEGTVIENALQGTGTVEDPYIIKTTEQLIKVNFDLASCYKLGNDIDLAGMVWTPIGSTATPFTGTFDGNGYTISNFKMGDSETDYQGFFGAISNATIKNLTLSHAKVFGKDNVGALVSYAAGANKLISNCHIKDTLVIGNDNVGGMIGSTDANNAGTIYVINCTVDANVIGNYNCIGGLVGWYRGSLSDIYVTGQVIGGKYDHLSIHVGGIAGYLYGGTMQRCYTKNSVVGDTNVGGLVGSQDYGAITLCATLNKVTGTTNIGGLVGNIYGVGINNCYTLATVTGGKVVGGLVGISRYSSSAVNSYVAGKITGEENVGGLCGSTANLSFSSCYYDSVVSPLKLQVASSISKHTSAMLICSTYKGWDFEAIWDIREGNGYPFLRVLPEPTPIGSEAGTAIIEGAGTLENPYIIRTTQQLIRVNYDLNSYYQLGNNIDLGGMTWNPIGTTDIPFTGTLDGNGFIISNFVIDDELGDYQGLFGAISNATIKDLTIKNVRVKGHDYVAALVGYAAGTTKLIANCKVEDVKITGSNYVGGLVGATDSNNVGTVYITKCSVKGEVVGLYTYIGGLVGWYRGSMSECSVIGKVIAGTYEKNSNYIGGLAGYVYGGTIQKCYVNTEVTGDINVGALIGYQDYGTISICASYGKVIGTTNVAGIVANTHSVTLTNCYALAAVTGTNCIGGLVGISRYGTGVSYSYVAGKVVGMENVGGLCGLTSNLSFTSCYYDAVVNPLKLQVASTVSKHTSAMLLASTFTNWNFVTIWNIAEGKSYPYLRDLPVLDGIMVGSEADVMEGAGTPENPYIIRTTEQLVRVNYDLNSYYQLGNDIDCNGMTWNPIGTTAIPFTGTLDGNGYTISNFVINDETADYQGLFGAVNNATIKDLTIKDVKVTGHDYIAAFVGYASGANKLITNCHTESIVIKGSNYVGGLVGSTDANSTGTVFIENCSVNGNVTGLYTYIGGLVGWYRGSMNDCYTSGTVTAGTYEKNSSYIGGLAGYVYGGTIQKCYSKAVVTGDTHVGGLIGYQDYGTVTVCEAYGTVTGTTNVGGLIGNIHGVAISNALTLAKVTGETYVGGLVGISRYSSSITNAYVAGKVTGTTNVGGLYGVQANISVSNSYYDTDVNPFTVQVTTGISKHTSAMLVAATYINWNFVDVWDINEGKSYPYLRGLPIPDGINAESTINVMEGAGTAENPYIIRTTEQLINVNYDLTSYYQLGNDLDLGGMTWAPIGTKDVPFAGTLDGNGYAISNFVINDETADYQGLFGAVNNATIKDLTIKDVKVIGHDYIAALVGYASGANKLIAHCKAENIIVKGSNYVGGLVGSTDASNVGTVFIADCSVNGNVTGLYSYVGGLVGWYRGSMNDCYTSGTVTAGTYEKNSSYIGGLAGYVYSGTIQRCYSKAVVTGDTNIGGLIGFQDYGTVTVCEAYGTVTGTTNVGGLIGNIHGVAISNALTLAKVTGETYVGGLVGISRYSSSITNAYVAGKVTGTTNVGGLYGVQANISVSNSYYDTDVNPFTVQVTTGISKHTSAMFVAATYTNWDFANVWDINEGKSYPYLRGLPIPDDISAAPTLNVMEGAGTAENPYIIRTTAQLINVNYDLTSYYQLGNNLDLGGMTWTPIGTKDVPFTGTLDGKHFTISNFVIDDELGDYQGLFGVIHNATIKDLVIKNVKVTGNDYIASLVGYASGAKKLISNCHTEEIKISGKDYVGGLIGGTDAGTVSTIFITNCSASGVVTGIYNYIGGLVGWYRGSMSDCHAYGTVTGGNYEKKSTDIGGLIGYLYGGTIQECYTDNVVTGDTNVGGLIGYQDNGTVSVCASFNAVTGTTNVGGIIGNVSGVTIKDVYSLATVTGTTYVGGIVGISRTNSPISNSYVAGKITGETNVGGLSGITSYVTLTKCYYDSIVNPLIAQVSDTTSKRTSAMMIVDTYSGWDFKTTWDIKESKTYPYLRALPIPSDIDKLPVSNMPEGLGTEEDPYIIHTVEELENIKYDLAGCYKLANDIDLAGKAWTAIGTESVPFTGSLDGDGHTISNFVISSATSDYQGLFGVINNATIKNLTLNGANVTGRRYIGVIAGLANGTKKLISNCHITNSKVKGTYYVGGLVGSTDTTSAVTDTYIINCTVDATVLGDYDYVGGLAGYYKGTIADCYTSGTITGGNYMESSNYVGGLVGYIVGGQITGSYSVAAVTGITYVGGLVGYAIPVTITNCFSLATVVGVSNVAGLIGTAGSASTISYSYVAGKVTADTNVSGLCGTATNLKLVSSYYDSTINVYAPVVNNDSSKLTGTMKRATTYSDWDFENIWEIRPNESYPYLKALKVPDSICGTGAADLEGTGTEKDPYIITTREELESIQGELGAYYKLGNDIDLEDKEWTPLGTEGNPFTGTFDGAGYTISHLKITQPEGNNIGLFGVINNGTIKNLTISGIKVEGNQNVGALVGLAIGTGKFITNCHVVSGEVIGVTYVGGIIGSTDTTSAVATTYIINCSSDVVVTATGDYVGGIAGYFKGSASDVYALDAVTGENHVGGLFGYYAGGTIQCAYSTGDVIGNNYVGGLIGTGAKGMVLQTAYSTGKISGVSYVAGLVGILAGGNITNCHSLAILAGKDYVGGLVSKASAAVVLTTSYFAGQLSATTTTLGGLAGASANITVKNSYFINGVGGLTDGVSAAAMKQAATYVDWNFRTIWVIEEDATYPYLKGLPTPEGINGDLVKDTPAGTGTEEDPYVIRTVAQLVAVKDDLAGHYVLANDLDLNGAQWNVIGTVDEPFTGVFDGNGYKISNFAVEKESTGYVGFFGTISNATIKNLTISGATVKGNNYVGTLVGLVLGKTSTIINCHVTNGTVTGKSAVGGIIGGAGTVNFSGYVAIEGCTSNVTVVASGNYAGGIIAYLEGTITNSYAIGAVTGKDYVGGLVGLHVGGKVTSCYSLSSITGVNYVGGLIGRCNAEVVLINCYFAGKISASSDTIGGLCGTNDYIVITSCYYDAWANLIPEKEASAPAKLPGSMVCAATYVGWEFGSVWAIDEGISYPYLKALAKPEGVVNKAGIGTEEDPYIITVKEQLLAIKYAPNAYYKLANDIDLEGATWEPIGSINSPFTGHFDGAGYTISNFVVSSPDSNYVGFFGVIKNAVIMNLTLSGITVEGKNYVGGLAGYVLGTETVIKNCHVVSGKVNGAIYVGGIIGGVDPDGTITIINCHTELTITATGNYVGGLVGFMFGTIENSYSLGGTTGVDYVGGLVGHLHGKVISSYASGTVVGRHYVAGLVGFGGNVTIKQCYSLAAVTGVNYVGGLIAAVDSQTTLTNCYVAGKVTATGKVVGGLCAVSTYIKVTGCYYDGIATTQMNGTALGVARLTGSLKVAATYAGWDFVNVWTIEPGKTYPYLKVLPKPSTVSGTASDLVPEGSGTKEDPYILKTAAHLEIIKYEPNAYYRLGNNIDLEGVTWTPIGTMDQPFTGHFDGKGYTISNFVIDMPSSDYVGFFGVVENATIIDLTLKGATVKGGNYVGALVGIALGTTTTITGCHVLSGTVTGIAWVGGLVGATHADGSIIIIKCSTTISVTGTGNYAGGIVGFAKGRVELSYTTGAIVGVDYVGGIVGYGHYVSIKQCYILGSVKGNSYVGGLIGISGNTTTITNCYVAGTVTGVTEYVGGLCGSTVHITVVSSYYDAIAVGKLPVATVGISKLSGGLKVQETFKDWNFIDVWTIETHVTYPYLKDLAKPEGVEGKENVGPEGSGTKEDPYIIRTKADLLLIEHDLEAYFKLGNDIDLEGMEWTPIGTVDKPFKGHFDGAGFTISNFVISNAEADYVGFFGVVSGATIVNVKLTGFTIVGHHYVGGLVGIVVGSDTYIKGCEVVNGKVSGTAWVGGIIGATHVDATVTVVNCVSNIVVVGTGNYVGGLAGYIAGTITGSYAAGTVTGGTYVGGLIGCGAGVHIETSYSLAAVTGTTYVGGFIGICTTATTVVNCYVAGKITCTGIVNVFCSTTENITVTGCYYDGAVCGIVVTEVIGVGKLTGSLTKQSTYVGWDFETVWAIDEGKSYPYLIVVAKPGNITPEVSDSTMMGEGTEESPYQIKTVQQLMNVQYELGSSYELMNDLDLAGQNWKPLGDSDTNAFTGTFNGNGHVIKNLTIEADEADYVGLFGVIDNGKVIDLTLSSVDVIGNDYVGSLAGMIIGEDKYIESCNVLDGMVVGANYVGGLIGGSDIESDATLSYIDNCSASNQVEAVGDYVGNLIGYLRGGMTSCSAEGTVSGNNYIGGLVGYCEEGTIEDGTSVATVEGRSYIGGLAGYSKLGMIIESISMATVEGKNYVGGVAGYSWQATIDSCESYSTVTGTTWVGGVLGYDRGGILTNCYSQSTVTGTKYVGGIVGCSKQGSIDECISDAEVTGSKNTGDIVGSQL